MRYTPGKTKDREKNTGQYTPGFKFMFRNGKEYKGMYHYYNNLPFTGAFQDENSIQLYTYTNQKNVIIYNQLKNVEKGIEPIAYSSYPTEKEYEQKFFKRYFVKKRNEETIIEIDKNQYETLTKKNKGILGEYYLGIELEWKIKGPRNDQYKNQILIEHGIEDTNQKTVYQKNKEMPGLINVLTNYLEYARII